MYICTYVVMVDELGPAGHKSWEDTTSDKTES